MASSTFPSSLSALLSTTMYTPALLFRSLRISGPSIPPSTPSLPLLVSSLQPRSFSVHPPSLSTTLPPPTPFYTPRPKRATRSREASPSALAWSSEPTANAVKEFAHLAPVAPGVDTEQEKSNLELAGRFSDKTYTVDKPKVIVADPAHLYTSPPPLDSTTTDEDSSSTLHTTHFRTFLTHHKNLLTIHTPLPLSTYKWDKETSPKEQYALRKARWAAKTEVWDKIASGELETLPFEEAEVDALDKLTSRNARKRKLKANKEGAPEARILSLEEEEERKVEMARRKVEREELRISRTGIVRDGFAKGGRERLFLEKYLGKEVKKESDGRAWQPPIGRKRKVH